MEYGILVVRCDDMFQIIGEVDSVVEAREMANGYTRCALDDTDNFMPPDAFEIHRRDDHGWYTKRELFDI